MYVINFVTIFISGSLTLLSGSKGGPIIGVGRVHGKPEREPNVVLHNSANTV